MAAQEHESLYSDSVCSSPRSVGARGGHDEEPRVRFMCSYGGRILPRPHDNQLRYVGGDTRIVAVGRHVAYSVLVSKLSRLWGSNVTVKYQLPNEDLDSLISVTTDEDLENMMEEYDRLNSNGNRSSRLRLFLFPAKLDNASSLGSLLEGSKREHWFLDALNGVPVLTRRRSEVSSVASEVPDYLFGLDTEDWDREDRGSKGGPGKSRLNAQHVAEAHSAPSSPVPLSSPYGSTSSAPPSIDTHVITELAAKSDKFSLHPATSDAQRTQSPDQTTKLDSKPEKGNDYSPEAQPEAPIVKQEAPVEASQEVDGSGSNLSDADGIYRPAAGAVMTQQPQMPAEHYVDYTHAGHYVQQGQPAGYWQMHEDMPGHVYYAAGAAPPFMPRQPAYVPVQRVPMAYGADMQATHQGVVLPGPKLAGSYPAKQPGKAPLYRAPRPAPPVMMRAPVPSSDPYAYPQFGYEATNAPPQQLYYTQRATVMNPVAQYQPMMAPVAVDLQTSPETISEGPVRTRVSGSV